MRPVTGARQGMQAFLACGVSCWSQWVSQFQLLEYMAASHWGGHGACPGCQLLRRSIVSEASERLSADGWG